MSYIIKLILYSYNFNSISGDLERLKVYRENNERKSREVVQSWETSISQNLDGLGKER